MIRNYLLIALRNLWRNKLITVINLVGMAIGFCIFLSFWSWVRFDLSFDKFHEDIDQMYVLNVRIDMEDSEYASERTGGIFASVLKENFPQVISSCRVSSPLEFELGVPTGDEMETVPMKFFSEKEVLAVDSIFLHYFSFNLLKGDNDLIFMERDHMVITESLSKKLFGDQNPLFQSVRLGEGDYYQVVGVTEDPPEASSFQFQALVGFHVMEELGYTVDGHGGTMYYSNFKLAPETDIKALNLAINDYTDTNFDEELDSYFFMDTLTRIHLYGETRGIIGFYMNLIMALVILSIACINFINLTTAFASRRIKEIAIRKSAGASKGQLVMQFLGETYLLLLFAFYLGLFLAEHMVPAIFRSFGVNQEADFSGLSFWIQIAILFLLTGQLAGLYPAVKIAGFKPLAFLSGKSGKNHIGGSRSRKILIVVQFTFSVIFILVSVFMIKQYVHLKEADLGFNRDEVLYIRTTGKAWDQYPQIKRELAELHFVDGITSGSSVPVWLNNGDIDWGEREGDHNKIAVLLWTDPDFLSTFEIDLREGAYFSHERDSLNYEYVVVNQALVDLMGWEDPVGRSFYLRDRDYQILGVTANIDFFPFNLEVFNDRALIYQYHDVNEFIFVRINQDVTPEQIAKIEVVFQKYNPGYEFAYDFVSDYEYDALQNGDGIKFIFILFSLIAIFIAVMGLIGLSVFNNSSRTKEVGIRKAMGAHTGIIMKLLLTDFMKLVVLSNLIGMPLAYLILNKMLQIFSYRIDLKVSIFILVFLLSVFLSLATVVFHAFLTARSNPVNSLRYE
jgi:putative ABC transport system permease protein